MRHVFADTCYWIALISVKDALHSQAKQAEASLGEAVIHTTEEVLCEYLNFLSGKGKALREAAARAVHRMLDAPNIIVHPQTHDSFLKGLALYENRGDKQYSIVDCISFVRMQEEGIVEALTNDHHFQQEGLDAHLAND